MVFRLGEEENWGFPFMCNSGRCRFDDNISIAKRGASRITIIALNHGHKRKTAELTTLLFELRPCTANLSMRFVRDWTMS